MCGGIILHLICSFSLSFSLFLSDEDEYPPNRTPEHLESLPKNATALRGRRGAIHVRQHSICEKKGHRFLKKFFRQPAYCSYCHEFLW